METLNEAFLKKYPTCGIVPVMFTEATGCSFDFKNITKLRLSKFIDFMSDRLAKSTVRQYCAKVRAVLNLYNEVSGVPAEYLKMLSLKNEKAVCTWLNDSDLEKLVAYSPRGDNERWVRALFLIGAYTGCRRSDFIRITEENIVEGCLRYVSAKTKTLAVVPLKPVVLGLMEEIKDAPELSEATFNNVIRRVCRSCGIAERVKVFKAGKEEAGEKWQFVTSHTARKSFCTNLYLRGADLYSISKMAGHSSIEMTAQNYICCGLRPQSEKVLDYFK